MWDMYWKILKATSSNPKSLKPQASFLFSLSFFGVPSLEHFNPPLAKKQANGAGLRQVCILPAKEIFHHDLRCCPRVYYVYCTIRCNRRGQSKPTVVTCLNGGASQFSCGDLPICASCARFSKHERLVFAQRTQYIPYQMLLPTHWKKVPYTVWIQHRIFWCTQSIAFQFSFATYLALALKRGLKMLEGDFASTRIRLHQW